jgi:hypothetical protein
MSDEKDTKGKRAIPLSHCPEHGTTVAILDEPNEKGEGTAEIAVVHPMKDGQALMPGQAFGTFEQTEEGLRFKEVYRMPGGTKKARTGWSKRYEDNYDKIDWGKKPKPEDIN